MNRYLVFVAAVFMLAGCSSKAGTSTDPLNNTAASGPASSAPSSVAEKDRAHVGDTITVQARDGSGVDVTLVKVAAAVKSTDGFSTPAKGSRYFAAQFSIAPAKSGGTYSDSPTNGAVAVTAEGEHFNSSLPVDTTAGHPFGAEVRIRAGAVAKGWIVFEVPAAAKVTSLQFGLESGFGNSGEWIVP